MVEFTTEEVAVETFVVGNYLLLASAHYIVRKVVAEEQGIRLWLDRAAIGHIDEDYWRPIFPRGRKLCREVGA